MYIISKNLGQHKKSQFFATTDHVAYYEWRKQTNHTLPHRIIIAKAVAFYVVQELLTIWSYMAMLPGPGIFILFFYSITF